MTLPQGLSLSKMTDDVFLQNELDNRFDHLSSDDCLSQMTALREFKNECYSHVSHIEVAPCHREMISLALTAITEVILKKVYNLSVDYIIQNYQLLEMSDKISAQIPFAILAYGNLGAKELNYASDLDLVFLYDTPHDDISLSLYHTLSACEFTTRLAQRIIYLLSTPLASGVLFQVDIRLRPDGNAGLLVSSLTAFSKYLHENAWNWEHRALVKARMVVGAASFNRKFELLRKNLLERDHDVQLVQNEIIAMRKKMSKKYGHNTAIYDLKTMEGGVTDIDFVVQYAILRYIKVYPDLINERSSLKILLKLREYKLLSDKVVQTLMAAYSYYQSLARKQYLQPPHSLTLLPKVKAYSKKVKAIWLKVLHIDPRGTLRDK